MTLKHASVVYWEQVAVEPFEYIDSIKDDEEKKSAQVLLPPVPIILICQSSSLCKA